MIRIKKNLNEEEMLWLMDELMRRFDGADISKKYNKAFQAKLHKFVSVMKGIEKPDPVKKPKKKAVGVVKRVEQDKSFSPGQQELLEGEIVFTTLRELLESVRPQHEAGMQFRQYTNPVSQLIGYATDDDNKYVINIVDLRKDPRADSFTFNPMKLLEA